MFSIRRLLRPAQVIPEVYQHNFKHLYFDVAWWGVLQGTILLFLSIYLARLGATPQQVGFFNAAPGLINMLLSLPAGQIGSRFSPWKATCWSAFITRSFYLLLVILPFFFSNLDQIWLIILISLVLNIPATMAVVMGNTFFAETVPADWRAQVVATRNAIVSAVTMLFSLISGQILDRVIFPIGYQIVFALGYIGGMVSIFHITRIRPYAPAAQPVASQGLSLSAIRASLTGTRFDILHGKFGRVLLLMFLFHFALYSGFPLGPLYQVNVLGFNDQVISLGQAIFYVVLFLGSTQIARFTHRFGYRTMNAWGLMSIALSILLFIYSFSPWIYLLTMISGGIGWALLSASLINYIFERVPENDRPAHLAWFNLVVNAAMLFGSLGGAQLGAMLGLAPAMAVVFVFRVAMALLVWKFG
jgi:MFS family permease